MSRPRLFSASPSPAPAATTTSSTPFPPGTTIPSTASSPTPSNRRASRRSPPCSPNSPRPRSCSPTWPNLRRWRKKRRTSRRSSSSSAANATRIPRSAVSSSAPRRFSSARSVTSRSNTPARPPAPMSSWMCRVPAIIPSSSAARRRTRVTPCRADSSRCCRPIPSTAPSGTRARAASTSPAPSPTRRIRSPRACS